MGRSAKIYASRLAAQTRHDMAIMAMSFMIIVRGGRGAIICTSVNGEVGSVNMNYK
jgi:hypothetical protein